MQNVDANAVRAQLARISKSEPFARSQQLCDFLRFVVEETIAGRANRLTAYSVATLALGRCKDFDPETDAIMRVQAVRLRRRLVSYYLTDGISDEYRIVIPKGSYAPRFEINTGPRELEQNKAHLLFQFGSTRALLAAVIVISAITTTLTALHYWHPPENQISNAVHLAKPLIEIRRFRSGLGWEDERSFRTTGLAEALPAELSNKFSKFRRIQVLSALRDHKKVAEASGKPESAFVFLLEGLVNRSPDVLQVNVRLVHAATNEEAWSEIFEIETDQNVTLEQQESIASQIVSAIAQPNGILDRFNHVQSSESRSTKLAAEFCIQRVYAYWNNLNQEELSDLQTCLEEAVSGKYAEEAAAWAALSLTYVDLNRAMTKAAEGNLDSHLESAENAANMAYRLDPKSEAALRSLYTISFVRGDIGQFKRIGKLAIAMNPLNANTLADFGRKLGYSGEWAEGVALAKKAIRLHPAPPDWYKFVLIHDLYRKRKHKEALELALSVKTEQSCGAQFTRALNYSGLGETQKARNALRQLKKVLH